MRALTYALIAFYAIPVFAQSSVANNNQLAAASTSTSLPMSGEIVSDAVKEIKEENKLSVELESYHEKSQASFDADNNARTMLNYAEFTYKLDEEESLRVVPGVQTTVGDDGVSDTQFMNTYVQYANSKMWNVYGKDLSFVVRPYLPTNKGSLDDGLIIPQIRTYVGTSFNITEKFTISPLFNPRFYIGDNSYRNARSEDGNAKQYASIRYYLSGSYAFSDRLSYSVDLALRNGLSHGAQTNSDYLLDNYVSADVYGPISMDIGFANTTGSTDKFFSRKDNSYYFTVIYAL
tara:strand:- start:5479 stop:6351 length:873 start_codon:yes stop_codon:yes gene_type:complete